MPKAKIFAALLIMGLHSQALAQTLCEKRLTLYATHDPREPLNLLRLLNASDMYRFLQSVAAREGRGVSSRLHMDQIFVDRFFELPGRVFIKGRHLASLFINARQNSFVDEVTSSKRVVDAFMASNSLRDFKQSIKAHLSSTRRTTSLRVAAQNPVALTYQALAQIVAEEYAGDPDRWLVEADAFFNRLYVVHGQPVFAWQILEIAVKHMGVESKASDPELVLRDYLEVDAEDHLHRQDLRLVLALFLEAKSLSEFESLVESNFQR